MLYLRRVVYVVVLYLIAFQGRGLWINDVPVSSGIAAHSHTVFTSVGETPKRTDIALA